MIASGHSSYEETLEADRLKGGGIRPGTTNLNLLTKFDFVCKGRSTPAPIIYKYPDVVIARRRVEVSQVSGLLQTILEDGKLETGAAKRIGIGDCPICN